MVFIFKKKNVYRIIVIILAAILLYGVYKIVSDTTKKILLGAYVNTIDIGDRDIAVMTKDLENEKYFRPSKLPVLNNNKETDTLINEYFDKSVENIMIPKDLLSSPEETIINYFSLLREAANPVNNKYTGCGSLGTGEIPYKVAYNFFDSEYKNKINYKKYKESFENILHINLIKLKNIKQVNDSNEFVKMFYEIETIEGSEKGIGYFAYYYGDITLKKVGLEYKILDVNITPEQYLCAPYHSWFYDAESSVAIKYGQWCNLLKTIQYVESDGYIKNIYFKGNDNKDYKIEFFTLTNDYDIEIAKYIRNDLGEWEVINLNPEDCLKEKN